ASLLLPSLVSAVSLALQLPAHPTKTHTHTSLLVTFPFSIPRSASTIIKKDKNATLDMLPLDRPVPNQHQPIQTAPPGPANPQGVLRPPTVDSSEPAESNSGI